MSISFRMIYDPLVSVKSEFGQSSLSNRRFGSDESTESFSNKVQSETSKFQNIKDTGNSLIYIMVHYSSGGTKLGRYLPKNQHTQRKLLNFENWVNGEVSKSAKF